MLFSNQRRVRVHNVAFVQVDRSWSKKEQQGFPWHEPVIAVEDVSLTDCMIERLDKVAEYLGSGPRPVWVVAPFVHTVAVNEPDRDVRLFGKRVELDGGAVLPHFRASVARLYR